MADNLGLGSEVRELKLGQSFTNPKSSAFHAIRYDFKPASVDTNKMATVDIGNSNQVTVTVPHLDGAGVPQTVFKGSQRPFTKECVLIIDRITGEMTLEKLSGNIQVKKTRSESSKPVLHTTDRNPQGLDKPGPNCNGRPQTPPLVGQRNSSRTKVTSGARKAERKITHLVPKHSPLQASPNYNNKSPKRPGEIHGLNNESQSHSALASLPRIGGADDFVEQHPVQPAMTVQSRTMSNNHSSYQQSNSLVFEKSPQFQQKVDNGVEEMSDSSSSSSSSDSDSDIEKTAVPRSSLAPNPPRNINGFSNSMGNRNSNSSSQISSMPSPNVYDDLQLSEDSD